MVGEQGQRKRRRLMIKGRIERYRESLEAWSFDNVRALGLEANVAAFRRVFPWVEVF